ncbi:unnamed protein product [Bursaphelenchus xylophilus]|uniref:(pine wood nematode) hypothetical protein n=1 Tax=Bursaphelenchus xylophilus TaxID=6326 RepID=A0A1I7S7W0_BURXY|nr:unnamed protein product [Bursaphelenchus xylophilus]CAG9087123.1 unnamed protein product [Bursaphelenchus xylophilus]
MKILSIVCVFLVTNVLATDDFASAKAVVIKYISANFTDDFLTAAFDSIYCSVQNNATFVDAHEEFDDEMLPLLLTQTEFVEPFTQLSFHVGSISDLWDILSETVSPSLQSAYDTVRDAKPATQREFSNLIVKVLPKSFFAEAVNNVQAALDTKTWKYLVSDLYCVLNFSVYGIKKS